MKRLLTIIVFMLTAVVAINAQGSVTVSQSAEIDALVNGKKASKKNNKDRQKVESQNESARPAIKTPDTKQLTVPKLNEHKPEIAHPDNSTLQPVRTKIVKRLVRRPHVPSWDEVEDTRIVTKRIKKGTQKVRGFRVHSYCTPTSRQGWSESERTLPRTTRLCTFLSTTLDVSCR